MTTALNTPSRPDSDPALDFNLADPACLRHEVMLDKLGAIRHRQPVFWSEMNQAWLLTRHQDVAAAFKDLRFSAANRFLFGIENVIDIERVPNLYKFTQHWVINRDGVSHKNLRVGLMKAFNTRTVDALKPKIEEIADELINEIQEKPEVEYVHDVAFQLPARVIVALLGLDRAELPRIREWTLTLAAGLLPQNFNKEALMNTERAIIEMNEMVEQQVQERRARHSDDLLGHLTALVDDGELSMDDLLGTMHILLVAGHDTTANSNALALHALLRNPEQTAFLRDNLDRAIEFIPELARYTSMSAHQHRVAAEDIAIGDVTIPKGDFVLLSVAAANHDPEVFDDPGRLDLQRDAGKALTFAPGLHFCLGHYLARVELGVFYQRLFESFNEIRLMDGNELHMAPAFIFRGPTQMRVAFSK